MDTQNVLVINGHPDKISFNEEIAQTYIQTMKNAGIEVNYLPLRDLNFDLNLKNGFRIPQELEPDLVKSVELLRKSTHTVWIHPLWWYGLPALLKGFIDRTFLSGIAYKFTDNGMEKLFAGRSARIIYTADTPEAEYEKNFSKSGLKQLKTGVLEFSGFSPVTHNHLSTFFDADRARKDSFLKQVQEIAMEDITSK
ncbi:NAD(P)H-dependent oxidoreductase [Flavobacterium pectinovorum]|jgi:NAD(P)H dehydrogenase (quinone)|uniref:Flavodoxin family protein n=1 Tax=Flavobacterium pectinovorum TaxID=29533 RepID=A0A502EJX7_9FLAO|nr:NAD(P)H-dependent oxidoreductase [Flavobacterium pectinovorum]TPG37767.1 flavodoxin family protein [Flavobacterium pectinovorum]